MLKPRRAQLGASRKNESVKSARLKPIQQLSHRTARPRQEKIEFVGVDGRPEATLHAFAPAKMQAGLPREPDPFAKREVLKDRSK